MIRNVYKQADLGRDIIRMNERIDLTVSDLNQIKDTFDSEVVSKGFNEALLNAIINSFYFGVNTGYKQRGREVV